MTLSALLSNIEKVKLVSRDGPAVAQPWTKLSFRGFCEDSARTRLRVSLLLARVHFKVIVLESNRPFRYCDVGVALGIAGIILKTLQGSV